MVIAIVLIAIVVASLLFHLLSPWQPVEIASNWGAMDQMLTITLAITGLVFAAVILFTAWALIRYRHRAGSRAHYQPDSKRLEWWLMGLTGVGIIAMLAPGLVVYSDFINPPADAMAIDVVGQQWQWSYRFGGDDGKLGLVDVRFISAENPFGIDPDDPNGRDDRLLLGGTLHLPEGQPVKALLRSKDVLHNFYVPQFRAKMDLVPGMVTHFWFTPTRQGSFEILCAELCGVGHYNMRGQVVVASADEFSAWLAALPTFASASATAPATDPVARGRQVAQAKGCIACHSSDGSASVGPTWKGLFGSERRFADGSSGTADEAYLHESIATPNARVVEGFPPVMPPVPVDEAESAALVAYIESLRQ
jgi:cytochrome c oxidase subunit 2